MRAVIYARISDDRTGLAAGVERQEADARTLCQRKGWDVVGVEVDNDISASRYSRKVRPAYQRVLAAAEAGEVDVIACYDVDRLYRRPAELEDLIDVAERTLIASVQGDLRLDTADGRAMARILCAMAAKSSDDTSRRLKRKHQATAEAGLPTIAGPRPFGFEEDRVRLRESEAQRIREAAARIMGGDSLGAICRDWNAAGVLTPKGNQWQTSALRRMLEAPRVAGLRSLGSEVVADAVWPAIIDRKTWETVRARLAGRAKPTGPQARSYLLSGLIYCGTCQVPMTANPTTVKTGKGKLWYRRYACLTKRGGCNRVGISADRTEETVRDGLLERLTRTGTVGQASPFDLGESSMVRLVSLQADKDALAAELGNGLSPADYSAGVRQLDALIAQAQAELSSRSGDNVLRDLAGAADPEAMWDDLPWDRRRTALTRSVVRVLISPSSGRGHGFEEHRVAVEWSRGGGI